MNKAIFTVGPVALAAATWTPIVRCENLFAGPGLGRYIELQDITVSFDGATAANEPVLVTMEELDSYGTFDNRLFPYWTRDDRARGHTYGLTPSGADVWINPSVNPASDGVMMQWQVTPNGGLMILPFYGTDGWKMWPGSTFMICATAPDAVNMTLTLGVWE